ncbi:ABC transporter permease subunit [Kroppenstedtia pulmonis]|uniref:ABC transporter permease subunit n=1 Tax=Kroppenstedtia pulmonis TaxID=1380685 RepID=A0A7D3XIU2_9BACL|nr:ABC transporter permease [Kroppenstedtia pulmonis]QKG84279.1 ABC transporter permease subunit [Kroppenstedtia pulmonis]
MLRLIRLEAKKNKFGWYWKATLLANPLIACLIFLIGYIEKVEGNIPFQDTQEAFIIIGAIVRATFTVFAAVLIAKLVVEEYKNKTIFVMFTYPVNRKKLIAAKLLIISGLTFIMTIVSNIFVTSVVFSVNSYLDFIPLSTTNHTFFQQFLNMLAFALATAGTSIIPLYFGMRKHSVPATILSSILIIALTSAHNPLFSLASIIYIPVSLAVIGVIIAFWSIRNIEKADVH